MSENKLKFESSAYLIQHKENPVHWHAWNDESIALAKSLNKPVFLSIGYSSCHWCHVMAHESFEDKETAEIMNKEFFNIKVDREERPDIDDIYMEAVQIMTKHGGWPLSVFLTPDLKPFFGGTYFPLEKKFGQPSFKDVLFSISKFYQENKNEVIDRSSKIAQYISNASQMTSLAHLEITKKDSALNINKIVEILGSYYKKLIEFLELEMDKKNGGFGKAPKFPQPLKISVFLNSIHKIHKAHSIFTLNKIRCGGITDQIGGGVSRYSVDSFWLVPHFEKMLYDNAQLLELYARASCLIKDDNNNLSLDLETACLNIFHYLNNDLKCKKCNLHYSAEDADSEGEEGFYYTLFEEEIETLFSHNYELKEFATQYFKISKQGNFEGKNILTIPIEFEDFCKKNYLTLNEAKKFRNESIKILKKFRETKIRPLIDDKCLLAWNALTATSFLKASIFLNNIKFFERGIELTLSLIKKFKKDNKYWHCYINGSCKDQAVADDLGFLLETLTEAFILTGCESILEEIIFVVKEIHKNFIDPIDGILYYSNNSVQLFTRPTKPEDNVIPSAHSAIFASLTKVTIWLKKCNKYDKMPRDVQKMFESLALICVSNTVLLAENKPIACINTLQIVKWFEHQDTIIINENSDTLANLMAIHTVMKMGLKNGITPLLVGNKLNNKYNLDNLKNYSIEFFAECVEHSFTYCNTKGCKIPTKSLNDIFIKS